MRLRLEVPGEPTRILAVTGTQSLVIGRKHDKYERLRGQLASNQAEVEVLFEAVNDCKVGGIHLMLSYSRRSKTFRVVSYAKKKRRTFCDRPISADSELISGAKSVQGYVVLCELEYYHLLFLGTRILLFNPDEGDGPTLIVDDISGCLGSEGFLFDDGDRATHRQQQEARASEDRVWNLDSTRTGSRDHVSFDLTVNVFAGRDRIWLDSQAVLTPDRVVIFSGTFPGRDKPALLRRGEADPAGRGYASADPKELEYDLKRKLKTKHRDAWTHVYRVPVENDTFLGPLFLVRFLSTRGFYVMVPIHDELRKSRRGQTALRPVASNKTHEFFDRMIVGASTVRFHVARRMRRPTEVHPPRVALRTADCLTLEWLPAECLAPVIGYEVWLAGPEDQDFGMVCTCEGLLTSVRLTGLTAATCYTVFLTATTANDGKMSSVCVRAATSTIPSALMERSNGRLMPAERSGQQVTTYAATYGDTPMALTEYGPTRIRSPQARGLREKIELLQGLVDHANVERFFGGTEFTTVGADHAVFQLRTEAPMPSLVDIWPDFGAPNVVPHLCREITSGLAFLHAAGVIHGNICPATILVRTSLAALEADPDSILEATFVIGAFDCAVLDQRLRLEMREPEVAAMRQAWVGELGVETHAEVLGRYDAAASTTLAEALEWWEPPAESESRDTCLGRLPSFERVWEAMIGELPPPHALLRQLCADSKIWSPELLDTCEHDPSRMLARLTSASDVFSLGTLALGLVLWDHGVAQPPQLFELMMAGVIKLTRSSKTAELMFGTGDRLCRQHAVAHCKALLRMLHYVNREQPGLGDRRLINCLMVRCASCVFVVMCDV